MSKKGGFLCGALFGAVVATGAALLFSPKSGKELREDIKKQLDDFKESDGDYLSVAKEKKEVVLEKAAIKKDEWQDKASELQEKLSEKTSGKSDEALDALKDKKEALISRFKKEVKTTGDEEENIVLDLRVDLEETDKVKDELLSEEEE
ncbi:Gas vesicle protein [Pilibacter termitis]|uniref:Gas vesicle protein n=1 Tax=Pilibacter termitis TaxID=263852 RepID=A0A1T4KIW7_9ENTE|nr:YtxH domain-containing protein [Pilibacter termitis]SJZ42344.1 Gas vesicle protein [Pilibacter termitis]